MLRLLTNLFGPRDGARDTGASAEKWAADWLRRERKFTVVAENWRNPRDRREEIDLVCRDREVLVFVEVKARVAGALVPGYFAVDRRKKRVLLRAATAYLARLNPKPRTFRFDIVEVELPGPTPRPAASRNGEAPAFAPVIRHFDNVPLFPKRTRG